MKKITLTSIVGLIAFACLVLSALVSLITFISTNDSAMVLRSGKLVLGALFIAVPLFIRPKILRQFQPLVITVFYLFIFFAIFCGEVFSFYSRFTHFDSFLHVLSGALLSGVGFQIIQTLDKTKSLPIAFHVLFAFTFAMTLGAFWEMYEFTGDRLLGLNMQRFEGQVGWHALYDTMKDIFCNTAGSLTCSIVLGLKISSKHRTNP